jgi:23S rRNA (adenine2503-C2)-methyltransferase
MAILSAYSRTQKDWENFLIDEGGSRNALPSLIEGLYKDRSVWIKHLSKKMLNRMEDLFDFSLPTISFIQESQDGTVKFLVKFKDHLEVETVLIPFYKRFTVCLSTQVGCAMNCSFCFTGTQGLKRNLTSGEIVGQYMVVRNWLFHKNKKALIPSIVFMGQGEPLHNADELHQAIKIFQDPNTLGVGLRQMTLSTVGHLTGIKKLKDFPRINVALSLHSPFEEERSKLIPVNERFPLKDVMAALDEIPLLPKQFITYEYLLIKNFNMTDAHVDELFRLLEKRKAIINLIAFNPYPGSSWERPETSEVEKFKEKLVSKKLRVMIRTTKGLDILAACGQLKVKN